jgi:hypothetical protein
MPTQTGTKGFTRIEAIGKILAKSKAPITEETLINKSDKLYADQPQTSKKSNLKAQGWECGWAIKLLKAAEVLKVDDNGKIRLK